jgi:integrase
MRNEIRRGRRNGFGRRPANDISGWADRRFPSSSTAHAAPQLRLQPVNDGHDARAIQHYLGHRSTASMVRYTALAPDRLKEFWKD